MNRPRAHWLLCLAIFAGCAAARPAPTTQDHHVLRLETCLSAVAHVDPGPIDGVADAALEQALTTYADAFARTDVMAIGLDPTSEQVRRAAVKSLLYRCWREGQLPPGDPLAAVDPSSKGYK